MNEPTPPGEQGQPPASVGPPGAPPVQQQTHVVVSDRAASSPKPSASSHRSPILYVAIAAAIVVLVLVTGVLGGDDKKDPASPGSATTGKPVQFTMTTKVDGGVGGQTTYYVGGGQGSYELVDGATTASAQYAQLQTGQAYQCKNVGPPTDNGAEVNGSAPQAKVSDCQPAG